MEGNKTKVHTSLGRKVKRIGKVLALLIAVLIISVCVASVCIDRLCCAKPPAIDANHPILSKTIETTADGYKHLGESYMGKRDGILRMVLKGDPFSLGYCNASLAQDLIEEQETSLFELIQHYVPSRTALWLLKKYVLLRNRNLPSFVPHDYQVEIYGISLGYKDPFPDLYPLYHRMLNYHAAHDISHAVMDSRLIGCTSFAAWDKATSDGHLLLGRNFDFNAGRCFDENKIVILFKPDEGLEFISVAWPGMIGVVSGINEEKIAVTVNAANSADSRTVGMPVSLLIRDVMQRARTLQQAFKIIADSHVFVCDSYLIADGETGQAAVVEKTPLRCAMRNSEQDYIICSNHFLTDELKDDEKNLGYMKEGTSVTRYERMEKLVRTNHGSLAPKLAAEILRDRMVQKSGKPALGNDAAINPFIATHSVIMDVTDGIIWVSSSPHQLGKFIPFSLENFEQPKGASQIAADAAINNGQYDRFLESKSLLSRAQSLLKKNRTSESKPLIRKARELNPTWHLPFLLLGGIALQEEDWDSAKELLHQAQSLYPPYASERAEINEMITHVNERIAERKSYESH